MIVNNKTEGEQEGALPPVPKGKSDVTVKTDHGAKKESVAAEKSAEKEKAKKELAEQKSTDAAADKVEAKHKDSVKKTEHKDSVKAEPTEDGAAPKAGEKVHTKTESKKRGVTVLPEAQVHSHAPTKGLKQKAAMAAAAKDAQFNKHVKQESISAPGDEEDEDEEEESSEDDDVSSDYDLSESGSYHDYAAERADDKDGSGSDSGLDRESDDDDGATARSTAR